MKANLNLTAHRRTRGFTLIEIIVVVVILAILAAVVIPRVFGRVDDAKVSSTMSTIQALDTSLDMYKADTLSYPTSEQGLNVLVNNPGSGKWNGPYLKNQTAVPMDAWGHPFVYKQPGGAGRDYDLYSVGPNGNDEAGAGDDIPAWNVKKQ